MTTEVVELAGAGAMYFRGIDAGVVREAKAAAAREGITLTALVQRAIERDLERVEVRNSRLSEIAREIEWYEANRGALVERFDGEHLAILDGEVIDHDARFESLAARVAERYGSRSVFMPRCTRVDPLARVRSPRIAR